MTGTMRRTRKVPVPDPVLVARVQTGPGNATRMRPTAVGEAVLRDLSLTLRQAALRLGVSHVTADAWRAELGVVPRRRGRPRWIPLDALLARLGREPDDALAAEAGVCRPLIVRERRARGIPPYVRPGTGRRGGRVPATLEAFVADLEVRHPGLSAVLERPTLAEVADWFGLSRERVRQIHRRLAALRAAGRGGG